MGSNIEIIQGWLDGTKFRPVSINFIGTDNIREAERKVGEEWADNDGRHWKKTTYGKTTVTKILGTDCVDPTWKNCRITGKPIVTSQDEKMWKLYKKCFDQVVEEEHNLRMAGLFNTYAASKVLINQRAGMEEMIAKCKSALKELKSEYKVQVIANEFGDIDEMTLPKEKMKKDINSTIRKARYNLKKIDKAIASISQEEIGKIDEIIK